jgi:hypothetical protein
VLNIYRSVNFLGFSKVEKNDRVTFMIPLNKLKELPRSMCLRKAAGFFSAAERRLVLLGKLSNSKMEYLASDVELLSNDEKIPEAPFKALNQAYIPAS